MVKKFLAAFFLLGIGLASNTAFAQDCPIKLGAVLPVSGPMGQVVSSMYFAIHKASPQLVSMRQRVLSTLKGFRH